MFDKKEAISNRPDYLLTKYQLEIYNELMSYMKNNALTKSDVAKKMGVSNAYVSQILNGGFNFTLKKLIEFGILIGKVPAIEFQEIDDYVIPKNKNTDLTRSVSKLIWRNTNLFNDGDFSRESTPLPQKKFQSNN